LGDLKEDGYVHLVKGLESPSPEMRLTCLKVISPPVLTGHREETMPLLLRLLNDPDPLIRQNAVARLPWFGKDAAPALPALEAVAKNDQDADVRTMAKQAIGRIKEAISGTIAPRG
jgi:hypothetical protein